MQNKYDEKVDRWKARSIRLIADAKRDYEEAKAEISGKIWLNKSKMGKARLDVEREYTVRIRKIHMRHNRLLKDLKADLEEIVAQKEDEILALKAERQRYRRWKKALSEDFRPLLTERAFIEEHGSAKVMELRRWAAKGFHNMPAVRAERDRITTVKAHELLAQAGHAGWDVDLES